MTPPRIPLSSRHRSELAALTACTAWSMLCADRHVGVSARIDRSLVGPVQWVVHPDPVVSRNRDISSAVDYHLNTDRSTAGWEVHKVEMRGIEVEAWFDSRDWWITRQVRRRP
jgi:hypothetical protein